MEEYDVVIAGGSISGLMSAREIAKKSMEIKREPAKHVVKKL